MYGLRETQRRGPGGRGRTGQLLQGVLLTSHFSLLTTHYSLLTAHYSLLTTRYSKVSPPGGAWMDGDAVTLHFAPTLWTAPLNDYHPEHNATLAFMFGPLVLAGLHLPTDVFVPLGGTARARSDPASFITRNSTPGAPLEFFGLSAAGQRIHLIPLRDVADEQYVAYFMTAGEGVSKWIGSE